MPINDAGVWQVIDDRGEVWVNPRPLPPPPQLDDQPLFRVPVLDERGRFCDWVMRPNLETVHLSDLPYADQMRIIRAREREQNGIRVEPVRFDPRPRHDPYRSCWADFENTVGSIFERQPCAKNKSESVIGLELENETQAEFQLPRVNGWQHHTEGSLRNFGFEYVQSPPAGVPESLEKCANLLRYLKKNADPQQLLNTSRTSTHVHFDVCHYNFKDVLNFACTYWILEEYLSNFCGKTRKGNLFCLRLKDSAAIQVLIKSAVAEGAPWNIPLSRNDYRYSSLNFASVQKFGTLEFRMMAGTDKLEDIETWVKSLDAIKKFALRFKNPTELSTFFIKECEARQFPRTVLGPELAHIVTARSGRTPSEIETDIRSGFMMVYPILAAHGTWEFSKEIAEEKERLKEEKIRREAELEEQARQAALRAAARANFPPIPASAVGQDEAHENVDNPALVEFFDIIDE